MSACNGCEVLPEPISERGTLYISPPLGHTYAKLRRFFRDRSIKLAEPYPQVLAVSLSDGGSYFLESEFTRLIGEAELQDTKSLIVPEGVEPSISELMHMRSLKETIARVHGSWLVDMMREDRLLTYFQPIVRSIDPDQVYAYECLLRGRDATDQIVAPDRLYQVARAGNLLFHLDRAARLTHIRSSIEQNLTSNIFINFNPTSIYDPTFCLRSTVHAIEQSEIPPERFVFEVVESEEIKDPDRLPAILDFYRKAGFRVALDDLGSGYSSLGLLTKLRPDFIKLDMQLIRNVDQDPYKGQIAAKILELCHDLGIVSVAEGIETPGEWHWVTEHGADYVQGYLFAKPNPIPPLRSEAPAADAKPSAPASI